MLAGSLISSLTVRAGVVGRKEGTDDKLARLDLGDRPTDLLNNAAVLVPHRSRFGNGIDASVRPQVGPAHAGGRDPDNGIRGIENLRFGTLLKAYVARPVKNSSFHGIPPPELLCGVPTIDRQRVADDEACTVAAQP